MAQQINLYSPILLAPRRYFSALTMLCALLLLALGVGALGAWSTVATQRLRRDLASATRADEQEKKRLTSELARRPSASTDTAALSQELVQAKKALVGQQRMLAELTQGTVDAERSNSTVLELLAQTVPAAVWLTEVRRIDGRLELAGMTLQPEALRPWLTRLSEHPALSGQSVQAMKVERSDAAAPGGAEAWSFRVVSERAATGEPS